MPAAELADEVRTRLALLHLLEDVQHERDHVREMRHQWVDTVDSILDPIMVHDGGGRIMRANKAYAGLAGIGFPEIIGRLYWECFPRLEGPLPGCADAKCAAAGRSGETLELPGGELYTSRVFPLRDDGSGMPRALHLFKNVTQERREAEYLLARSAAALGHADALQALASSPALAAGDLPHLARELTEQVSRACNVVRVNVWLFNAAETALACVDHYDAAAGIHSAGMELRQEQFENEFHALKAAPFVAADDPLTDPRTAGYVEGYLKPNRITSMLDVAVEVSGRHLGLLCLEHVDQPHHWTKGEIVFAQQAAEKIAIVIANRDAHRSEQAMRDSERRFRGYFELGLIGMAITLPDKRFTDANDEFCAIVGFELEELLGKDWASMTHPEDLAADVAQFNRMLAGEIEKYSLDKRFIRPDGAIVHTTLSAMCARSADGSVKYVMVLLQDITARKENEAEIRALARFPDENPNAVMRISADGRVLYANPASLSLQGLWGATPGSRVQGGIAEIVRACLASGEKQDLEMRDGERVFAITVTPIATEGYANIYGSDVTERKKAEEARDRSERYYRKLIEGSSDAFFVVDGAGKLAYRSESAQRLTGYAPDEVIGKDFIAWVLPESQPAARSALAQAIQGPPGTVVQAELRVSRKDGTLLDVEAVGRNLLHDPDINGIVVTARDLSERRRAELAPRASKDLLECVVENAPMRVFWKDANLRFLGSNSAFARDAGLSKPGDLIGKDDAQMPWHAQAELYRADDRAVIESDTPKLGFEELQSTPDGRTIWLRTSKVPLHDAGGRTIGILGIYDDITGHKLAEENLRGALAGTVEAMAATVEARDPYTAGHQHRVAHLAAAIASEMGLPAETVAGIRFGAMIHDVGKIQVPAELLTKPTRLTKLEFELIKTHAQAGYDIVKRIKFPWRVAEIVHQHHERLDGSGYPQGLKGDAIALEARIVAVADVVEAMSSHRPYRPGLGIDAALKEIESRKGTWFEPDAVDACLRLFREKNFSLEKASA